MAIARPSILPGSDPDEGSVNANMPWPFGNTYVFRCLVREEIHVHRGRDAGRSK